jgi:hypothetical protein
MSYDIRYAYLSKKVYDVDVTMVSDDIHFIDPTGGAWVLKHFSPGSDGYQGAVFQNADTNEVVLANRGTEEAIDVVNDIMMGVGLLPTQYASARNEYLRATEVATAAGLDASDIVIVGHSLGGSLAQLLGAEYGNHTETFNAYGAGNLIDQIGIQDSNFDNIFNHVLLYDPVSSAPGSKFIGTTTDYMRPIDEFLSSPTGLLLSQLSHSGLFERALLGSHGIGNFLSPELADQSGKVVPIDVPGLGDLLKKLRDFDYAKYSKFGELFKLSQLLLPPRIDPLAIDLDGDGIETIGVDNYFDSVLFDHDGDGLKTASGWVKGDDGFLVLDRNGNGLIDNGGELFGVDTVLQNGQKATSGFQALAELDDNADGQIDANDAAYQNLKVWRDIDQDGISQTDELFTLDELGIGSISLNQTAQNQNLGNGNQLLGTAGVTYADGTTTTVAGLALVEDKYQSQYADALRH